jgi:cysteine synthase A
LFDDLSKTINDLGSNLIHALGSVQDFLGKELSVKKPVRSGVFQLVGDTPIVYLPKLSTDELGVKFYLKAEFYNPTGSGKDRSNLAIIEDKTKRNKWKLGESLGVIGSGSSALSFVWASQTMGFRCVSFLPESCPKQIQDKFKSYGSEIVMIPDLNYNDKYILENWKTKVNHFPDLQGDVAIPNVHYRFTGPEIYRDLNGEVDVFVCGGGSGGTITGVGRFLKSKLPQCKIVLAVEEGYDILGRVKNNPYPDVFDPNIIDEVLEIKKEEGLRAQMELYQKEGIFTGLTTGITLAGASRFAQKFLEKRDTPYKIVVLSPDRD